MLITSDMITVDMVIMGTIAITAIKEVMEIKAVMETKEFM